MIKADKSWIQRISLEEGRAMIDCLVNGVMPGAKMPQGLFLWKEGEYWIGLDNLDYYAWVEQFEMERDAEDWLVDYEGDE